MTIAWNQMNAHDFRLLPWSSWELRSSGLSSSE